MKTTPLPRLDDLKRQLAQLDELIAQGVLNGEAARAERARLEREVLDVVRGSTAVAAATAPAAPSRALWLLIAAFVLVFGAAGYAWRGNFGGLAIGPGAAPAVAAQDRAPLDPAQIDALLERLAEHLRAEPNDVQGWAMLARSYAARGRAAEAVAAFKRVVDLRPGDAQALADYADGLALARGGFDAEAEQTVRRALEIDPKNLKALALAGSVAFERADYAGAAATWERAVAANPADDDFSRQLREAIVEARQRTGGASAPTAARTLAAASAPASAAAATARAGVITGRVTLGAALASKVGPDDTLFIYARAPSGSRMPLAILRTTARALPLDFKLDDSLAMSPAARLSSADKVVVDARISKSGNALPQPGDLQGSSAVVPVGTRDLRIEIGQVTN